MIPAMHITAWSKFAPWGEQRQIEQDLIISRAIIDIFSNPMLTSELRFRGGTALNKLHFPQPLRYSEDIDLVRTTEGPIGPILSEIRKVLEPWLGKPAFDNSPVAPKFNFTVEAEDGSKLRLKLEINTREREVYDALHEMPYSVENPWFAGAVNVPTFTNEEMLATKLRALLQRDKGRDLFDISHALSVFENLDTNRTVDMFGKYLEKSDTQITRAQAEQRMFAKLASPRFLSDMRPLVTAEQAENINEDTIRNAFEAVFVELVQRIPGNEWAKTPEMMEKFGFNKGT